MYMLPARTPSNSRWWAVEAGAPVPQATPFQPANSAQSSSSPCLMYSKTAFPEATNPSTVAIPVMKGSWPIQAHALGGRHYRGDAIDQNLDTYGVEYTFEDGTKLLFNGRTQNGCHSEFASYAHGTKGSAVVSTASHSPGKVRTFKGHNLNRANLAWAFPQPEPNPYDMEWEDLVEAIRNDHPYNEAKRGAEASLVTSMGRMAGHTGQIITFDQILNSDHEFAPEVDKLTLASAAPLQADATGKYPVPEPGVKKQREY